MVLLSVPALYDGKEIRLLEALPYHEPYRVVVTFVEPASQSEQAPPDLTRFWSSFGAWQDDVPAEETMRRIHESRRSRIEPPTL
jgi:hypothetical protein